MSEPLSEAEAFAALGRLYEKIDAALAGMGQPCSACGKCCHFAEYDHVLMCTDLEAAYLAALHGNPPRPMSTEACGFQDGDRCMARAGRPLACRTFLCRPLAGEAFEQRAAAHERTHRQIKALCDSWPNGYRYGPIWTTI